LTRVEPADIRKRINDNRFYNKRFGIWHTANPSVNGRIILKGIYMNICVHVKENKVAQNISWYLTTYFVVYANFLATFQACNGAQPTSYKMGTGLFPESKSAEVWH
jgi:hypothetical protein